MHHNLNDVDCTLQETNHKLAALNGLGFSVWCSRGAGLVLAFDGGMILVPMLRNIIRVVRPKLAWLFPADENIWFHRQVAYQMLFWSVVHTTAHYVNFFNVERTRNALLSARNSSKLTLCIRGPQADRTADPLHSAWWHNGSLYAAYHRSHVQHCPLQNPSTMFRGFLVHPSSGVLFHDWPLHSCYGLLCTRLCPS